MQTITVKAAGSGSGTAQRIATGAGRQRTVLVDFAKSAEWNYGNAAGTLANVLGWRPEHRIERGKELGTFVNHDM